MWVLFVCVLLESVFLVAALLLVSGDPSEAHLMRAICLIFRVFRVFGQRLQSKWKCETRIGKWEMVAEHRPRVLFVAPPFRILFLYYIYVCVCAISGVVEAVYGLN